MSDKPRLTYRSRLWFCTGRGEFGMGYSPANAYEAWTWRVSETAPQVEAVKTDRADIDQMCGAA